MNSKSERKRNVRPKTNGQLNQPSDDRQNLHIGSEERENVQEQADDILVSPPTPCRGKKDNVEDSVKHGTNISRIIKEEIIPALHYEIGDIVEDKIRKVFHEREDNPDTRHCRTCSCADKDRLNSDVTAGHSGLDVWLTKNPTPCNAIFVEETDIPNNTDDIHEGTATNVQQIGGRKFRKFISNPVYHLKGQTLLVQTKHGAKLVRYGLDAHEHDTASEKDEASVSMRSETSSGPATGIQPEAGIPEQIETDERECLAIALQWHIKELVDVIELRDREFLYGLLTDGIVTEDEYDELVDEYKSKDRVRVLLCLIKGRDIEVLTTFLEHLREHNERIANSIEEKFAQNKKDGIKCTKCALCKLTSQVNLKYIADELWREDFIDDGLFNSIVQTDKPTGAQGDLWHGVVHSLNRRAARHPSIVCEIIRKALKKKNHYNHVAAAVELGLNTTGQLDCHCVERSTAMQAESIVSLMSSLSPRSSVLEAVTDSQGDHVNLIIPAGRCKEDIQKNLVDFQKEKICFTKIIMEDL